MDDDAGRARERSEDDRVGSSDRRPHARDDESDEGFSLSLPPVSLPEMRLPERIRLVFPVPDPPEKQRPMRVRTANVLLAAVAVDALDAAAVALFGPETLPWARAAAGTLVSILFVGFPGLLYPWELLAILTGFGPLSLAPTATALVLARMLRAR